MAEAATVQAAAGAGRIDGPGRRPRSTVWAGDGRSGLVGLACWVQLTPACWTKARSSSGAVHLVCWTVAMNGISEAVYPGSRMRARDLFGNKKDRVLEVLVFGNLEVRYYIAARGG